MASSTVFGAPASGTSRYVAPGTVWVGLQVAFSAAIDPAWDLTPDVGKSHIVASLWGLDYSLLAHVYQPKAKLPPPGAAPTEPIPPF